MAGQVECKRVVVGADTILSPGIIIVSAPTDGVNLVGNMSHGRSLQLDFQMRASSADSIRASRFFGLHNRPDIRLLLPMRQHGYLLSSGRRPYKDFPKELP